MAYQLRKEKIKNRIYLKIYFNFREPGVKAPKAKFVKALGYVDKLTTDEMPDPIAYYTERVAEMNNDITFFAKEEKFKKLGDSVLEKHLGYFPAQAILRKLNVHEMIDILCTGRRFSYDMYECISALVFARIVHPCSKKKTIDHIIPMLWEPYSFSYDMILSCLDFIGSRYEKVIEIFTRSVMEHYDLDTSKTLFDCTNIYFEIDREDDFRKKGPSKENRKDPIYGMGLLLDANAIPIGMKLYPGNESEKPILRTIISELKAQNNITGRTVQVADKGLNCAANIIAAVGAGDGYLFSKSIKKLPQKEKEWVLMDDGYENVLDEKGNIKFRIKSCIDEFTYTTPPDEKGRKTSVKVKEKRVVTFNPKLQAKQRAEIDKMVDKAKSCKFCQAKKSEYGESAKYMIFSSQDENGELNGEKAVAVLNEKKINEDRALCGYNMLVTSEINMSSKEIYDIYHELWRIEETFKCGKSELELRPVYLHDKNKINGHFLICYLAVLLERIFQFKVMNNEFGSEQIYEFFRDFRVVVFKNQGYSNISKPSPLIDALANKFSLPILHLYMSKTQIEKVLSKRL